MNMSQYPEPIFSADFCRIPLPVFATAVEHKFSGCDFSLLLYLNFCDPWGDRIKPLPQLSQIAQHLGFSIRQVHRSLNKILKANLFDWHPVEIRGQNTPVYAFFSDKKKLTNLSEPGQNCPSQDKIVQIETNLSELRQICPNQAPEPLLGKGSASPHTIHTITDLIHTSSDREEDGKKAANLPKICEQEKNIAENLLFKAENTPLNSSTSIQSTPVEFFPTRKVEVNSTSTKHWALEWAGEDTPWLEKPKRPGVVRWNKGFLRWHGERWKEAFAKSDVHQAMGDFRMSLINNPDKIEGRWDEYQGYMLDRFNAIMRCHEAGIAIADSEKQYLVAHSQALPIQIRNSLESVNLPIMTDGCSSGYSSARLLETLPLSVPPQELTQEQSETGRREEVESLKKVLDAAQASIGLEREKQARQRKLDHWNRTLQLAIEEDDWSIAEGVDLAASEEGYAIDRNAMGMAISVYDVEF